MRNFVSLRGSIRSFRRSQGDFAACGRRVSFPAMGKKPMAQATFSWPCGPIHLEDRRGTAQDGHFVSIFALPPVPHYGGYPLEQAESFRRAKSGVLGCHSVRPHWGPEQEENWDWCDFIPAPAASEPTSRGRSRRRGGPMWPPASLPPCRGKVAGLRPAG